MQRSRILGVVLAGLIASACASGGLAGLGAADQTTAVPTAQPSPTAAATPKPTTEPEPTATPTPSPKPIWEEPPVAANDAAALARQMTMVESSLRDPAVTGAQLAWLGHLQQLTYGRLADYPEWKDGVLAALPDTLRPGVANGLEAGRQLRTMHGPIPKNLPDWKIVEPAPIDDLMTYYKDAQAEFGVPWYYLAAIHLVETRMGRIRGLSSAGAQGPMQFMPATWAAYGKGDVQNTHDAILGAARYLKASGAPGNMPKALFAYNHSNAYVSALIAYADVMKTEPLAYRGYHGWQVYYPTLDGPIHMPVGWTKTP
jgi:hypothetical protein